MRLTHRAVSLVASLLWPVALAACESDSEDPTGASGSGGGPAGGNSGSSDIYEKLGIDRPPEDTPDFTYADLPAPYEDVDGCKAFSDRDPDIRSCACDSCFELMRQCDALEGCREMFQCMIEQECVDVNDCYFGGKCTEIIDRWGNTGASTAISRRLGTCSRESNCTTW
jgi:hypothetical protein